MIKGRVEREVEKVAARYRRLWRSNVLSATWLAAALVGVALMASRSLWGFDPSEVVPLLLGGVGFGATIVVFVARGWARDARWVARRIEASNPKLDSRLLAALELKPDLPDGKFGFLQETVLREVLSHARRHPWRETVPDRTLRLAEIAHAACLSLLGAAVAGLLVIGERTGPGAGGGLTGGSRGIEGGSYALVVDPGDAEIERGSSLLVLARFGFAVPPEVTLWLRGDAGEERRIEMAKSLDDPVFAARLASVEEPLSYRVELSGETSATYRVEVFDLPELTRADARLVYPKHTGLEPATIVDTRRVSAVEGTDLTWVLRLNKAVERAWLASEDGSAVQLEAGDLPGSASAAGEALAAYTVTLRLLTSTRHEVRLLDAAGRVNRDPPILSARVLPNRRPDLKIVAPAQDVRVSPLEELSLAVKVWDDFGLERYGLSYSVAGGASRVVVLGELAPGKEAREAVHLLDFEALGAEPDQLVSYHFWALDAGPDGRTRRTSSDMYFAEVRPFEEIFRQGEEPPGGAEAERERRPGEEGAGEEGEGEGEGARSAEELAELQKRIVNGTWKLIRRVEESAVADDERGKDGELLRDSQGSALERTNALGENLEDAESKRHAATAAERMGVALEKLTEAVDRASSDTLGPALAAEQAAYDALLKLRAREFEVVRARSRGQEGRRGREGSSSRSSGRSRAELQQLQLSSTRNRYEMQRDAASAPEGNPAEREDRQVLDRLRDLARRQGDVNERLKELQSALAEARDEAEREETIARLKRLREEEQQILEETDELAERMEEPGNQQRMAEARDRLGETRENVRRASEALEEGQVSTAAASGARAEREMRELSDEFRERAAGRFAEEMREMRSDAEALSRNEEDLGSRLAGLDESAERSLRGTTERERIQDGLEGQRRDLGDLLDRMEATVEEAEKPEPLLAEKLYDTLRQTRQGRTDESLDVTRRLLEGGFLEDAGQLERQVREGLRALGEGVAEAAESVLGDETEALRRARREIERLAEEVEGEIARAGEGVDPQREREETPGAEREGAGQRESDPESRGGLPPYVARGDDGGRDLAPIGGDDFRDWADRLRDVEEMIDDPDLRAEAARIRDEARGLRSDVKRHSKEPNWGLVRLSVAEPLKDLGKRVGEELLRRESRDSLVPIDSDPVPPEYAERVREYYERLGSGK